jgi:uncharacterized protein (DUF2345 family)
MKPTKWPPDPDEAHAQLERSMKLARSMSKAAARHWTKAHDPINKLEQARRREFGLTSADLYPPMSRNSEPKE